MTRIEVPNIARARSGRGMRYLLILLLVPVVGVALWTWLTLDWAYSDGTRAGVLQKFSRRGWICKTQEGELAQYVVAGVSPQIWLFSVRDASVAAQLEKAVGAQVQLHYTEHPGVPSSCFADTRYFVDRVTTMAINPQVPGCARRRAGQHPAASRAVPRRAVPCPTACEHAARCRATRIRRRAARTLDKSRCRAGDLLGDAHGDVERLEAIFPAHRGRAARGRGG